MPRSCKWICLRGTEKPAGVQRHLGSVWDALMPSSLLFLAPGDAELLLSTITSGSRGGSGRSDNPRVCGLAINTFIRVHNHRGLN